MSNHTPGPWTIDEGITSRLGGPRISAGTTGVADLWDVDGYSGDTEANARLIAAAPELLETLRDIADMAQLDVNGNPDEAQEIVDAILASASAAIAKAEGNA